MPKYLVALAVGGLMECPEITYQDYQEIEADNEEDACKIYNEKNNCEFFYGAVIRKLNGNDEFAESREHRLLSKDRIASLYSKFQNEKAIINPTEELIGIFGTLCDYREYLDKQEVIALLRKWAKDAWADEWKPTHDNIRGDTFMEASLIVEDMSPVRVEEINNENES